MGNRASKHLWMIVATLLLTSCSISPKTDLREIYGMLQNNPDQPPVVVVHGALGSRLEDAETGKEHWPGALGKILFSSYRTIGLEIDPDTLVPLPSNIVASGIAESAAGVDFYGRILTTLDEVGGYRRTEPGTRAVHGEKRYYVFSYDWRQDNVDSARALDKLITRIRADYQDPNLRVDIVAHSMGGMISRYYVRYGTADVLNDNEFPVSQYGADRIRRVVLLGTPNLGSIGALHTLIRGYKVGLGTIPPEVVATFPSTYQVLPHAITNWFVNMEGKPLTRDQFSADFFWQPFKVSVFDTEVRDRVSEQFENADDAAAYLVLLKRYFRKHIERARRFSWSLTVPIPNPRVKFIVFGGDCLPTNARAVVEPAGDDWELRLSPDEIKNPLPRIDYKHLMQEPGDGTVTKASLLARQSNDPAVARHKYSFFPLDYPVFLCEKHTQLTGNVDFQNNLLHALLSVDR